MNKLARQRLVLAMALFTAASGGFSDAQERTHVELLSEFGERLAHLADKCDELKLADQAAITRNWLIERSPRRQYLFIENDTESLLPRDDASELVKSWHRKFLQLRSDHAAGLFGRAGELARNGDGTTAYQMLHEVLRHDPTHPEARRVLGLGSPSISRIARRPGTRNHPDFGWQRGRYWQIESEHYRITTNASADAGVELARQLESFHSVWRQVFFGYWSATESLVERFRGSPARLGTNKKLAVVLFADRDAYVKQLQRHEPNIAMSLGYYMKGEQIAFFYAGGGSVVPTWYHEATHQLFQELGDAIADVGEVSNFWIVEGIAVYMESLVAHDGYVTLGGVDAERLQYARVRALTGEFYLPLSELVRLGREDLQRHQDIRHIYTQAAGLTHFLMDGANWQYRQALLDLITLLYLGRAQPNTLASGCGIDLAALDQAYVTFLGVCDEDLVDLNPPRVVKSLALGRTAITDAGLERLAKYTALEWLDVSFTETTDTGLKHLAGAADLKRLNLEGTSITDASAEIVSRLSQLEELDLSSTKITDAGMVHLARLTRLKSLWLTNTQISDVGLNNLRALMQLEFLEVSQTNVTADALAELQAVLPQLQRD